MKRFLDGIEEQVVQYWSLVSGWYPRFLALNFSSRMQAVSKGLLLGSRFVTSKLWKISCRRYHLPSLFVPSSLCIAYFLRKYLVNWGAVHHMNTSECREDLNRVSDKLGKFRSTTLKVTYNNTTPWNVSGRKEISRNVVSYGSWKLQITFRCYIKWGKETMKMLESMCVRNCSRITESI